MEKTFAKSFRVENYPIHLKQDIKLLPSVLQCKTGTKNNYRTITKDMWYKIHPIPHCRSKMRFYPCAAIPYQIIPPRRQMRQIRHVNRKSFLLCARNMLPSRNTSQNTHRLSVELIWMTVTTGTTRVLKNVLAREKRRPKLNAS